MTAPRSPLDVAVPLLVTAVQLGCACVVLGAPDLAAARDFLTGTTPTMAGSLAAAQLVLWGTLAVAFAGALAAAVSRTAGAVRAAGGGALWSVTAVVIGALILSAGVNHRSSAGSVHL
ncbi:MAG TPA: hypothetical protein VLW53_24920, partial [Candidatus Eisenbacteria bacterium]|nr:hypothetical protein [Candidatus Eisenbacteria bacterium]